MAKDKTAKSRTIFFCSECGNESPKWLGKCSACGAWNSYVEEVKPKAKAMPVQGRLLTETSAKPENLKDISLTDEIRISTGLSELDRVLGGGVMEGAVVLIGGDPGIGKSTLLLQICQRLGSQKKKILYVSGEESLRQIKLRAERLGVNEDNLLIYSEVGFNLIEETIAVEDPDILMIDSIQTVYQPEVSSAAGSVSQVREVTANLVRLAKTRGMAVFIVGHVTKEGLIAGPRVLEHMVDTVLYFEGDKNAAYRLLRAVKNRFGATNEVGIFEMKQNGLEEVKNPSEYMLNGRPTNEYGSVAVCTMEGSRPFIIEVQALLSSMAFNIARRTVTGYDYNRLLMLLAVLERKGGLKVNMLDCFVNIAGGLKIEETAIDLGVVTAIYSAYLEIYVPQSVIVIGEVGLTGEVRGIPFGEQRIREARKLGFEKIILPQANLLKSGTEPGVELIGIKHIKQLKEILF
ncbi:DNA repair protein RadA [Clostridiales bacterium COT073_COT-073]|nr:DNA repair protein RadA [Clostridiales bacterium COT073_COT-073]